MLLKPQDILFIVTLLFLLWKGNPRWFVWAGLICFSLAMPLFAFWVFFTAQHLVWYGFSFILIATLLYLFKK